MPIEIRRSDVLAEAAGAFGKAAEAARYISRDLYEAERVKQVNEGLAFMERAFQTYNEELPKRKFDVTAEDSDTIVQKDFGEVDAGTLEKDYANYVNQQMDYLTRHVTNKAARRELIQHLQMGSLANRSKVVSAWNEASYHVAKAGLQELIETVMASDAPWDVKLARIASRVDEMVAAGHLWRDEGETIKQQVEDAAQYSYSRASAMEAMKYGYSYKDAEGNEHYVRPGPDAGERWLAENTPFYQGNPDVRQKILAEVRTEFDYEMRMQDEQLDRDFSDAHLAAKSTDDIDEALNELAQVQFYDGDMKYTWEQRFRAKGELLENLKAVGDEGGLSYKEWQDKNLESLWAMVMTAKEKDLPFGEIRKMVLDAYWRYELPDKTIIHAWPGEPIPEGAVHVPDIPGDSLKALLAEVDTVDRPAFTEGVRYINSQAKALGPEGVMAVTNQFRAWYNANPEASDADIAQAVRNLVAPVENRKLDEWWKRSWEVILGTEKVLTPYEQMTQDIAEGRYTGLVELRGVQLATYNAALLEAAKRLYPDTHIVSLYPDTTGKLLNLPPGTCILQNEAAVPHIFVLEGKQLILYRRNNQDGTWERLESAPEKAEAEKTAEKAAARAEREEAARAMLEPYLGEVKKDIEEGTAMVGTGLAQLTVKDWERVEPPKQEPYAEPGKWRNKATGEDASWYKRQELDRHQSILEQQMTEEARQRKADEERRRRIEALR